MVLPGTVFTGRIFSENLVFQTRRRGLSTERSGGECSAREIKKKSWQPKRTNTEKMIGKGTGAGLAAGKKLENNTPRPEKQKYEEYLSRLWSRKADEAVTVEIVAGGAYALASELVCLRLEHQFKHEGDRVNVGYSENLKTWFFCMEVNF